MAVLEKLRKRSGLLVGVVGIALFAFVLTGLFESRGCGPGEQYVGVIAGEKITYEEFDREVTKMEIQQVENMGGGALDPSMKDMVNNNTWDKIVRDLTLKKQVAYSGIVVTDDELSNMIIGKDPDPSVVAAFTDNKTNQINPNFADPMTGKLSGAKIKEYVDKLTDPNNKEGPEYYAKWKQFEQSLREARYTTKYFNLIKKGLYCTKSQAKQNYVENGTAVKFRYVLKRYMVVPDSSITVTEQELQDYYNANQKKFKQETSRKIEYVVWDVLPSAEDEEEALKSMKVLADRFKTADNDSIFVMDESETKFYDPNFIKKDRMPAGVDSSFFNAEKGSIFGPFKEGNKVKVVKLSNVKMGIDSGSARHILINYAGASQADPSVTRSKEQAQKMADSLLAILKKSTRNFPDYVLKFSSDSGSVSEFDKETQKKKQKSRDKLGYYMFQEGQMMKAFQDVVWEGKKGDLKIAETPYGFHIMEVLYRSPESKRIQLVTVEQTVEPSSKTRQQVFDKASDFAMKYNTEELFNKGVETEKLNKRIADPVKETDKTIAGLESPRDMIRWAYDNPKGTVTNDPFNFGNKYVVAMVAEVREKGIAPLEQKRIEVEIGAKQEKKAKMFIEEFNKQLTGSGVTIDMFSTRVKLPVEIVDNTTYSAYSIPNLGKENELMGVLFTLKEGQLSKPVKGLQGVYVVVVDKITPAADTKDYTATQKQVQQNMQYRVDTDLFNAMKTKAEVEDFRGKFY